MNILVCISSVPDTTSRIDFIEDNKRFNKEGIQFVINPYDEFGLTKAMMIKESTGGKVTVVTVGESSVEPVIRKALAIGADEAVRIDVEPSDSFQVAQEISLYAKDKSYDLIIAGRESIDYNTGAVPGMIAELLSLPFINACNGLSLDNNKVKLTREISGGKENLTVDLPIVIGGQKGLVEESELRIPNMRGIMSARTKPLEVLDPNQENSRFTNSHSFELPEEKADCHLVSSEDVSELVNLLRNEAKVI